MTSVWRERRDAEVSKDLKVPSELTETLASPMPSIVYQILVNRGFQSSDDIQKILSPKLTQLKDPLSILGMKTAVERLVQAFKKNEKICIYADFDLDGTSGLALLRSGLLGLGFQNVSHYQPKRLTEGYGFHPEVVDELKAQGVSLIITVDVGITAFAACERALSNGMDVILTDHHQPTEQLPKAYVVVNPNQRDCPSQLKYLCGAGVAFYLLRAVKRGLVDAQMIPEQRFDLRSVLDCFTIATLTDMVPIVEDNRVLVKAGLSALEKTERPGLQALLESLGMQGRPLTGQDVSIRFAPKLNALSRMELGLLPIDLYLVEDVEQARAAVKKVLKNNQTRVGLQMDGEKEAAESLAHWPHQRFAALASPNFHRGVVGLIATKVAQNFHRPAFIGSQSAEGLIVGSARVATDFDDSVLLALETCADILNRFGGHHAAAGFELHASKWPAFTEKIRRYFENQEDQMSIREVIYDVELGIESLSEGLMRWLDRLGPFGQSFTAPILRLSHLQIQSWRELSGGHWKMKLSDSRVMAGRAIEALWFSPPLHLKSVFQNCSEPVEILAEIQWNYFQGKKTIQVLIKEMRKINGL